MLAVIHWVINRVTSALGFPGSPISFSKTKLEQFSAMMLEGFERDPKISPGPTFSGKGAQMMIFTFLSAHLNKQNPHHL